MSRTDQDRHYQYFPAFLDLVRKHVVVLGGGSIAGSKVEALLPCGVARLRVVAPEVCASINQHAIAGCVDWVARPYQPGDLEGADLAFAATDNRALNACIAVEARERRIPVLAVDDVANCDFIAPALTRRGGLVIAVSTNGRSPAMARRVREWLDAAVPVYWSELVEVAAAVRDRLGTDRRNVPPEAWQQALSGPVEELARAGNTSAATDLLLQRLVEQAERESVNT